MPDWPSRPRTLPGRGRRRIALFALRGGKVVLSLVSVAVLALTAYGYQLLGSINEGLATTDVFGDGGAPIKPLDGAVDILLVGQDSRTDSQGKPLSREVLDMLHAGDADGERQTDTMILVHIPQDGRRAVAISFPRDSYVDIPGGYGRGKLNSAYVAAYNDTSKTLQRQGDANLSDVDAKSKIAGRKELVATLEQLIGRPHTIDRYAEVNLASFYEITKAIGGVQVCLNNAVHERKSGVDLPKGYQSVSGVQALAFVRQRYDLPNGDLDRIARQQAFLSSLAGRVLSPAVLGSPSKLGELIDAVKKSVVLSSGWDLLEFAQQMRGLSGGNVEFHTIPTEGNAKIGGADVVRIDKDKVRGYVTGLIADTPAANPSGTPAPSTAPAATLPGADAVTVDLFDGTGPAATGAGAEDLLRGKGFRLGERTELSTRSSTVLRYPPGDTDAVRLLQQVLGSAVQAEPDSDVAAGHVRVLLGRDYRPAAAETPGAAGTTTSAAPPTSASPTVPVEKNPITAGGVPCVN